MNVSFMSDRRRNALGWKGCLRVERAAWIPNSQIRYNEEGAGEAERELCREQTARTLTGLSNYFYVGLRVTTV